MERIHVLDSIEKDIITCLHSAGMYSYRTKSKSTSQALFTGQVFHELGKEKSSLKQAENHTQTFLKTLGSVESKLTDQINYLTQVSTGQPHEGSGYASQKVLQMAWHRLEHARSRVNEMDRLRLKHSQERTGTRAAQPGANGSTLQANRNVSSGASS